MCVCLYKMVNGRQSVGTQYGWMMCVGNPGSVSSSVRMSNSEEQAYLEKWKQLQKYVEPLKRMINKIDKDEGAAC